MDSPGSRTNRHPDQDTIKTRMQLNAARYPRMGATGRTIIAEEGVPALWKGLAPFAVHLFTKYALRFGTNATFQVYGSFR